MHVNLYSVCGMEICKCVCICLWSVWEVVLVCGVCVGFVGFECLGVCVNGV